MSIILLASACTITRNIQLAAINNNCNQQRAFSYTKQDLPQPIHLIHLDTALVNRFSFQSLHVANAIGILDLLTAFVQLNDDYRVNPSLEKKIQLVALLQNIHQRIHVASLEISAVASEMDCEEERADQVASYLKKQEDDTESKLTVGAIVAGAAGAIAAGVLLANNNADSTPEIIGIGAGLVEATLGLLILSYKPTIHFYHPRNALRDIWVAPETSSIFPRAVWYYLNYCKPHTNEKSLRQQLADKWLAFGQIADTKQKDRQKIYDLFFGEGGTYSADQLMNRANMYDQLEAHVNLMKQDLKLLSSEIEKISSY
ncbi:MAG: hypothetical protein RMJ87_02525 [Cytophagales bacterium]|nr:hypothetical protein [Bernardetiaceae bacterium]MDW8203881.1 hypothetical protein [Cytophagales bacterium]